MDAKVAAPPPAELAHPQIRLYGQVNEAMLAIFLDGLAAAEADDKPLTLELTTTGGDADIGRRIASDVRAFRARTGRPAIFLGKAAVYSAGVTIMSGFAQSDRWLAEGTMLLIHCRRLDKTVSFEGSLKAVRPKAEAVLAEIDAGLRLQEHDFRHLVEGSRVRLNALIERAEAEWYLSAEEARDNGLTAGVY